MKELKNERIKELAEAAYREIACNSLDGFISREVVDQRFAELVVKECLNKIYLEAAQYAEPVWAFELVNDIKEHFGVTE